MGTIPPLRPADPALPGEPPIPAGADPFARERELVAALLRKDRKAAAEFVAAHADAVYAYVRRRLAPRLEPLDDVVQDVFVAALATLEGYRGASSLRVWLLGIARHKIEDFYRRRLRDTASLDEDTIAEPVDDAQPIDEAIDRRRAADKAQRVLAQLPESYAVALLWRYWEGRSVREIAAATGRTEKAIERLLARARARFRESWSEAQP